MEELQCSVCTESYRSKKALSRWLPMDTEINTSTSVPHTPIHTSRDKEINTSTAVPHTPRDKEINTSTAVPHTPVIPTRSSDYDHVLKYTM